MVDWRFFGKYRQKKVNYHQGEKNMKNNVNVINNAGSNVDVKVSQVDGAIQNVDYAIYK